MFAVQSILLGMAVLVSAFLSASAISCYQCNSVDYPECRDLDVRRPDLISLFYQECKGDYNGSIPFCRKTDLTVMEGDLQRTIRSCGWVKKNERTSCYKADNDDHLETVCQCFENGCNAAPASVQSSTLVSIGTMLVLFVTSACFSNVVRS